MYTKLKIAVIATTMLSCGVLAGPAQAALHQEAKQESSASTTPLLPTETPTPVKPVKKVKTVAEAPADKQLEFEKVEIKSTPAPAPVPEVIVEEAPIAPPVEVIPPVEPVAPPVVPTPEPAPAPTPAPKAAPAPAPASGRGAIIASAALGQIGVMQDCTKLVTNSLAAVGINFHGWPVEYYSLGSAVSAAEAVPGDLIYYVNGSGPGSMAHIAIYIGNGQAVHGGWNGNETRVHSVNVGSGPQFIRLR